MKQKVFNLSDFQGFNELTVEQIMTIEGGSFWYDAAFAIGATAHAIWVFAQSAAEYQQSLPPNLKK